MEEGNRKLPMAWVSAEGAGEASLPLRASSATWHVAALEQDGAACRRASSPAAPGGSEATPAAVPPRGPGRSPGACSGVSCDGCIGGRVGVDYLREGWCSARLHSE